MSCFNVPYCVGSFKLCHMAQHAHPVSGGLISFRIGSNKSIQFLVSYLELGIWKIIISVMEMLLQVVGRLPNLVFGLLVISSDVSPKGVSSFAGLVADMAKEFRKNYMSSFYVPCHICFQISGVSTNEAGPFSSWLCAIGINERIQLFMGQLYKATQKRSTSLLIRKETLCLTV